MSTKTFIGSSTEGIKIANAIKHNLLNDTECHIWTEGVFLPGSTYIETLEKLLDKICKFSFCPDSRCASCYRGFIKI